MTSAMMAMATAAARMDNDVVVGNDVNNDGNGDCTTDDNDNNNDNDDNDDNDNDNDNGSGADGRQHCNGR